MRRRRSLPRLAREEAEIRGAIRLVAAGAATRVTIAGLRYGERLLPRMAVEARPVGITIRRADPTGFGSLVVGGRRIEPNGSSDTNHSST